MIKLVNLIKECGECGRDWNHGHDHEASMAKNELRDMISNASKIDNLVKEGDNLPGWVSAYISLAADYMHSVAEYLGGESTEMPQEPSPGYGIGEAEETETTTTGRHLHKTPVTRHAAVEIDFNTLKQGDKLVIGSETQRLNDEGKVVKVTPDAIFVKDTYGHTLEFDKQGSLKDNPKYKILTLAK